MSQEQDAAGPNTEHNDQLVTTLYDLAGIFLRGETPGALLTLHASLSTSWIYSPGYYTPALQYVVDKLETEMIWFKCNCYLSASPNHPAEPYLPYFLKILENPKSTVERFSVYTTVCLDHFLPNLKANMNLTCLELVNQTATVASLNAEHVILALKNSKNIKKLVADGPFEMQNSTKFVENIHMFKALRCIEFSEQMFDDYSFLNFAPNIRRLYFSRVTEPSQKCLSFLQQNSTIQRLKFTFCANVNVFQIKTILDALRLNSYLQSLNFCNLQMLKNPMFDFEINSALKKLSLEADVSWLPALLKFTGLSVLSLSRIPEEVDYEILYNFVEKCTQLKGLKLAAFHDKVQNGTRLFSALVKNLSITEFSFCNLIKIDKTCALEMAKFFQTRNVTIFRLHASNITNNALSIFFDILHENTSLTVLYLFLLDFKYFSNFSSFTNFVRRNSNLRSLHINGVYLGNFAASIFDALRENVSIFNLFFGDSEHSEPYLRALLCRNRGLYFYPKILFFVEFVRKKGWPASVSEFPAEEQHILLEVTCCAMDIPTEILTLIVDAIVFIHHEKVLCEDFKKCPPKFKTV